MSENKSNIRAINLSSYSYTKPETVVSDKLDWVGYGEDNDYFNFLIDTSYGSPTNNAVINAVSDLIYGKGLRAKNGRRRPENYAYCLSMFSKNDLKCVIRDFKTLGNAAFQVVRDKDGKWRKAYHVNASLLRAEKCNEEGEIKNYYYASDWQKVADRKETPKRYPSFEFASKTDKVAIYYIKTYAPNSYYYSPVDYQGGIQYAELEEEIANYHLNNIQNGLSPSYFINFNNGVPSDEDQRSIERRLTDKYSGSSNSGKVMLAFNDSGENAATIDAIQLSDADKQYEFLSRESSSKIMVAHRVTSPMLLGIKDNTGFGNNAEELKSASVLFQNTVIRPFQNVIIDAIDAILAAENITLDLYFESIQPLDFSEEKEEEQEDEEQTKLSKQEEFVDSVADELVDCGEDEDGLLADYDLIDEAIVEDYEEDERVNALIEEANKPEELSLLSKVFNFVSTGRPRSGLKSEQDGTAKGKTYLVRYKYTPERAGADSREFCRKMVSAKKLYRKEDIEKMGDRAVNAGFGEGGASKYSIWLYKGGARCSHKWYRKIYVKKGVKTNFDIKSAKETTTGKARSGGFKPEANNKKVPVAPNDMKYKGFSPKNKNMPKDARAQTTGV